MGIGLPFFIVGGLGSKLPKTGQWMIFVKYCVSLLVAGLALHYFLDSFTSFGMSKNESYAFIVGIIFIFLAVALGLKAPEIENRIKGTKFFFALLAVIVGASLIFRSINANLFYNADKKENLKSEIATVNETEIIHGLTFYKNEKRALQLAKKIGILLYSLISMEIGVLIAKNLKRL